MGPTPCLSRGGGAAALVQKPCAAHPLPSSCRCGAGAGSFRADPNTPAPRLGCSARGPGRFSLRDPQTAGERQCAQRG